MHAPLTVNKRLCVVAAVGAFVALITGCTQRNATEVTYRVVSSGPVGDVTYYTVQGLDGAVVLTDQVGSDVWSLTVDGGSTPDVQLRAPQSGEASCEIIDHSGIVISYATARDGKTLRCTANRVAFTREIPATQVVLRAN